MQATLLHPQGNAGVRGRADESAEMDEEERCCRGCPDDRIRPAERNTARQNDAPVSLADEQQQRRAGRPGAC